MSHKCGYLKCSNAIGLFLAILFAICFAWYFINPVKQEMHLAMFKITYYGFQEMNLIGFILGAAQSYIWAYVAVAVWYLVGCCMKPGSDMKSGSCCKE